MRAILRKAAGFLLAVAMIAPTSVKAQSDPIVWRGIIPLPQGTYLTDGFFTFQRMVDERLGGRLKIEYIGAAEITPPDQQLDALRNRVVDVILGTSPQYAHTVPEALALTYNRDMTPEEQRASGFYDLLRQIHLDKANVIYLASIVGAPGEGYRLYFRDKPEGPDLSGKKMRVSQNYVAFINRLNGTPVSMSPADAYSGLERGVVDGLGWPYGGYLDMKFNEVAKYAVDHPFYSHNMSILVNRDAWEELPEDLRADVEALAIDLEAQSLAETNAALEGENDRLAENGMEFITFSPEEAQAYLDAAYEAGWADFVAKNPENGPRLRELTEK